MEQFTVTVSDDNLLALDRELAMENGKLQADGKPPTSKEAIVAQIVTAKLAPIAQQLILMRLNPVTEIFLKIDAAARDALLTVPELATIIQAAKDAADAKNP